MDNYRIKELKVEVTYKCPLACVHCSSNANEDNCIEINQSRCFQIISEAKEIGVEQIAFSGGEPLIWPGIIEAVKLSVQNGYKTCIYTSGHHDQYTKIFSDLSGAGLNRAVFSLYSYDAVTHNRITRKEKSFDKTIASMRFVLSLGIEPEVHFVALASNYIQLPKIVEFVASLGIKKVSVLRFVPQGRGVLIKNKDVLSLSQNLDLRKIIEMLRAKGYEIRTGSPFNVLYLNNPPKCMAAQDRLIVAPDLKIYPCDAFKQISAEDIVGKDEFSALDLKSLADCWQNSLYLNTVRSAILSPPKSPCNKCSAYSKCGSGCLAQKYIYHKSLDKKPDPACLQGASRE